MRRDPRRIADPQRQERRACAQIEPVILRDAVEKLMDIDRAEIDGRHLIGRQIFRLVETSENVGQAAFAHAKIDAHRIVIEQPPANIRASHRDGKVDRTGLVRQIGAHRLITLPRRLHERPVGDQPAHDEGRLLAGEQRVERRRFRHLQLPHRGQGGGGRFSHGRSGGSCARPVR